MADATWNCCRLGAFCVHHTTMHFMQSHIRKVYACLAVTCHLRFWQDDRDLLRATAVTQGWNGYQNKSPHRKLTLEKKILPPPLQGFEPANFQSRVRRSNHWAIPAPHEVSGTFSFTCPVTALPVSYRRRLTLCTALSTSPPGHPGLPVMTCIYVVGLLPVELNFLLLLLLLLFFFPPFFLYIFFFSPPKINGSNSKLSLLWLHNLEKRKRTMKI